MAILPSRCPGPYKVLSSTGGALLRFIACVSLLPLITIGSTRANGSHHPAAAPYRDGIVLLAFQPGIQQSQQDAVLSAAGAREIKRIGVGVHVVAVRRGRVSKVVQLLRAHREVRFAEPDYFQTVSASSLPNDTFVGNQWAVQNTGQSANGTAGTAGADERSLAAWGITTGTNSVVVAVLDTGVQYSHPDLFTNMWNNPGGVGGCAAGTHGYNVLNSTCDPMDDDTAYSGHGTHVAGILGAVGNNAAGTAGVNWTTSIMALKWVGSSGTGATSDLITAMDWVVTAKQAGVNVRVANDSQTWAGTAFSQALSDEIDLLGSHDILFVTASGNTAQNNDVVPRYPCSYDRPTMICVAASDQNDNLWSSANYGPTSVQLAAPGVNIYSTLRTSNYGYISGGSMASPQVAGTAALILSLGYQSAANLRSMIVNNVDVLSSLSGLVGTSGRLNVCKAVPGCSTAVAAKPAISLSPVVTSIPQQGGLLGASTGAWTGVPSTYTYQWNRCDANGANCSSIPGATGQTYALLAPADPLATLAVTVTATNSFGSSAAQSSASSAVATATSPSAMNSSIASGATISGSVAWSVTPSRSEQFVQFYIDGVLAQTDASSPYVFNGTSGTLDTSKIPNGPHILGARALFTDNRTYDFYSETVTVSNPPQNTALPAISGSLTPGQTLSTSSGSWNPNAPPTGFTYQWEHCDSSGLNCALISGAASSTYLLSSADAGFTMRAIVTASNSGGSTAATSAQTGVVAAPSLVITTSSLPVGQQNVAYSATVAATGGTPAYTWSVASGSLPVGLTLASSTGVISGTPTTVGTSNFTVRVTDSNSLTTTQALSLTVVAPLRISTTSLPVGTQNTAYNATVAATGGSAPYSWSLTFGALPTGLTLASSTGVISGTPTTVGTSNFTVRATDSNSFTTTQALSLTVVAPVTVTTTSLPTGAQGAAYSATLAAAGGTSPYKWSVTSGALPVGLTLSSSTGVISGTPTTVATSNFTVRVTDANSLTATKTLSLGVTGSVAAGSIGLIQANAIQGSSGNSLSSAFPAANTAGNLIIAFVRMNSTSQTVNVTDTLGNTYADAVAQVQNNSDHFQVHLFYAKNVLGGANTVKATFSSSNSHSWLAIFEYAGINAANPLDKTAHAQGRSTVPSTGATATTTNPNELVFGGFGVSSSYTGTQTAGSGYALLQSDTGTSRAATESMLVTSTGSYTATLSLNSSSSWAGVVATFDAGGIGITTNSLPNATQNASYSTALAAAGGVPPYTWSIVSGSLPAGLTLAPSTGVISGTPTGTGVSNFTAQVTDSNSLNATKALSLTVVTPPVVTTSSLPTGTQNAAYSTTLAATGGTTPYTWSVFSGTLPSGLALASGTGVISGTPTATGVSNFTVQVSDANAATATQALSLNVTASPIVTTASLPGATQNGSYSATLAASGGTPPYTWSISTGTLPAGLALASSTGIISGTPTGTGTSNFTVQVTDTNSQSGTKNLSLTVAAPPTVSTTSLPGGTQNVSYSTTLAASGGTTPYTWSISAGTLPAGLSLASSTGVISGTPTGTGTSNFSARVTDANSVPATQSLSITVVAPPTVTTTSLPGGTQNTAYSTTLAASGGTTPYTWSISAGTLPAGLSLASSTGVISGTPTGTGTSNFTVKVTDANSLTATKALSITVVGPPTVTTASLPSGTQNAAYSATLTAAGGTTPYSWSISAGALPAGLTLASGTGVISGTPTGTGTANLTAQVTDANSLTATKSLSITISTTSGGGIGLVQENAVQGSAVGSVSVAFPTANTSGNLILAFVRMSTSTQTVTLTDTAGNAYVEAVAQAQIADGSQVHLFYAKSIPGAANTITATFSSTNNHPWLAIYEYRGLSTTSPLDQTAHAQGSSTAPNSGPTATTTSASELVFAAMGLPASYTGTQTIGSGYSLLQNDTSTSPASNESMLTTSTGSFAGSFALSATANWSAIVATFKP